MKRKLIMATVALVLGLGLRSGLLQAQNPAPRGYRPYRPTLTRYLDYFRAYNDAPELGGALSIEGAPSYNGFVAPRDVLRRDLAQQRSQLNQLEQQRYDGNRRLEDRLSRLQSEVDELNQRQVIRPSSASPTGVGGTFMNYSNFFRLVR